MSDIDEVLKVLNRIESDLIADRTAFDKITNKLDSVVSLCNTLTDRLPQTEDKVSDAVTKGVLKATQEVRDDIQEVIDKKVLVITKGDSLWKSVLKKVARR